MQARTDVRNFSFSFFNRTQESQNIRYPLTLFPCAAETSTIPSILSLVKLLKSFTQTHRTLPSVSGQTALIDSKTASSLFLSNTVSPYRHLVNLNSQPDKPFCPQVSTVNFSVGGYVGSSCLQAHHSRWLISPVGLYTFRLFSGTFFLVFRNTVQGCHVSLSQAKFQNLAFFMFAGLKKSLGLLFFFTLQNFPLQKNVHYSIFSATLAKFL